MPPPKELSREQQKAVNLAEDLAVGTSLTGTKINAISAELLRAQADGIESAVGGFACTCHEAFKWRGLADPDCRYHDFKSDTDDADRLRREADELEGKP